MGYKPIREIIQKESLDDDLRTGLWNVFYSFYGTINCHPEMYGIYKTIWTNYHKFYLDEYDYRSDSCWQNNRNVILFEEWMKFLISLNLFLK